MKQTLDSALYMFTSLEPLFLFLIIDQANSGYAAEKTSLSKFCFALRRYLHVKTCALTYLLRCPCCRCRAFPLLRDSRLLSSPVGKCNAIHWLPGCTFRCCYRNLDNPLGIGKTAKFLHVWGSRLALTLKRVQHCLSNIFHFPMILEGLII